MIFSLTAWFFFSRHISTFFGGLSVVLFCSVFFPLGINMYALGWIALYVLGGLLNCHFLHVFCESYTCCDLFMLFYRADVNRSLFLG